MTDLRDALATALLTAMHDTDYDTPEGAEFQNLGDWEQWTPILVERVLSDPSVREALADGLRSDYDCCAAHDDIRGDEEHIVARMLGDADDE